RRSRELRSGSRNTRFGPFSARSASRFAGHNDFGRVWRDRLEAPGPALRRGVRVRRLGVREGTLDYRLLACRLGSVSAEVEAPFGGPGKACLRGWLVNRGAGHI